MAKKVAKKAVEKTEESAEKAPVVEKEVETPKKAEKPKVPMTNEELVRELQGKCKEGEQVCIEICGAKFSVKEIRGVDLILARKDYK